MLHSLFKYGADPNVQDVHGRGPIHYASTMGNVSALTFMIKNQGSRINLNLKTFGGETAMFKAVTNI